MDISTLSRSDLSVLRRELTLLKALKKSLGNRSHAVYQSLKSGITPIVIEHPSAISAEDARSLAHSCLAARIPEGAVITQRINDSLIGGIRVFIADMMADVSFASVQKQLLK